MKNILLCLVCIGFSVISFAQDSLNMKRMAVLSGLGDDYNDVWGYRHGTEEFAVIGSNTAINIVNVTDCGNPILANQWVDGSSVIWRDFKEYGDFIYGVCDGSACGEGLQVINKNDYTHTQSLAQFRSAHNIFIEKESGRLYVYGSNTSAHGVYVYDIATDPENPTLLKNVKFRDLPGESSNGNYYIHDGYVKNDTAYFNHGYPGLKIWDMRDLNNVYRIGDTEANGGYNHSGWKHPSAPYLYVAEEVPIGRPMYVYDISDPTEPFITHTFKDPLEAPTFTENRPHNPFVKLNRLYISYYHDGFQVYDVSVPELPEQIAYYDTFDGNNGNGYSGYDGAWGAYPFLPSGCLLASDITHGLNTLKMTIAPEAKNRVSGADIVISDASKGIVYMTPDDEFIRVIIDSNGNIDTEDIGSAPMDRVEVINSNLQFESSNFGVVLRNSIGKYFRVGINNSGQLTSTSITFDPSNDNVILQSEDLYFSQYRGGLILKNINGECYHFTLGENGVTELEMIDCD